VTEIKLSVDVKAYEIKEERLMEQKNGGNGGQ
jgi:hypothetical protein